MSEEMQHFISDKDKVNADDCADENEEDSECYFFLLICLLKHPHSLSKEQTVNHLSFTCCVCYYQ